MFFSYIALTKYITMGLFALILIILLDMAVIYHIQKSKVSRLRKFLNSLVVFVFPVFGVTIYYLFLN